mmetsp:Transcript_12639/g.18953  ORF Transcript_12639/g.18953 Transcript_12639/m.18953 type:complete len:944 (+) Transcript_12639:93-2924(+)
MQFIRLTLLIAIIIGLYLTIVEGREVIYSWGKNFEYQLGHKTRIRTVKGKENDHTWEDTIVELKAGRSHSIILLKNGKLYGFGESSLGELGVESEAVPDPILIREDVKKASVGYEITAAVTEKSPFIYIYGNGYAGDGNGKSNTKDPRSPVFEGDFSEVKAISDVQVAKDNVFFSTADLKVGGFGSNIFGQLSINSLDTQLKPVLSKMGEVTTFNWFYAGPTYTYFVKDNIVYCAGENKHGSCGINQQTTGAVDVMKKLALDFNKKEVKQIASGSYHTLMHIKDDTFGDTIYAWGHNLYGSLGMGHTSTVTKPTLIPLKPITTLLRKLEIRSIAAMAHSSYLLTQQGLLFSWGDNSFGQLGSFNFDSQLVPTHSIGLDTYNIEMLSPGERYFVLYDSKRKLVFANGASMAQAASITHYYDREPRPVFGQYDNEEGVRVQAIHAGEKSNFISTTIDKHFTWGADEKGILAAGASRYHDLQDEPFRGVQPSPQPIHKPIDSLHLNYSDISTHGLAVAADTSPEQYRGKLFSWGDSRYFQTGWGNPILFELTTAPENPISLGNGESISTICAGVSYSAFLTTNFRLFLFGHIRSIIGSGDALGVKDATVFDAEGTLSSQFLTSLSCGSNFMLVKNREHKILAFGHNDFNQLGSSSVSSFSSSAVEVLNVNDFAIEMTASKWGHHALAISQDRKKIFVWGANSKGQLGLGNTNSVNSVSLIPVVIDERFIHVAAGGEFSLLLASSGELYGMGSNEYGQLAQTEKSIYMSPVRIQRQYTTDQQVLHMAAGRYHAMASVDSHTCYGLPDVDLLVCNGHGNCTSQDNCICKEGYQGPDCSTPICSSGCNNGYCADKDDCRCFKGFGGASCNSGSELMIVLLWIVAGVFFGIGMVLLLLSIVFGGIVIHRCAANKKKGKPKRSTYKPFEDSSTELGENLLNNPSSVDNEHL